MCVCACVCIGVSVCAAHVRENVRWGRRIKRETWCQQWQVSQPRETGTGALQDMLTKRAGLCVWKPIFFHSRDSKPDIVVSLCFIVDV